MVRAWAPAFAARRIGTRPARRPGPDHPDDRTALVEQLRTALTDALACAELYLAQVSELGWQTTLKQLR